MKCHAGQGNQAENIKYKNKVTRFVTITLTAVILASTVPAVALAQTPQADMAAGIRSAGLPVARVELFPAENAKGTAVLIPQIHQGPGTEAGNPANSRAERAQNEIYDIVAYLVKGQGTPPVMVEGELYGLVDEQKVSQLKEKIDTKNRLASFLQQGLRRRFTASMVSRLRQAVASANREIALAGGSYRLKAEGGPFALYGAENSETYAASANMVRDYIYLQDRIGQLRRQALGNGARGGVLLQSLLPDSAPSRSDNPYKGISDLRVLDAKLKVAEENIQRVVLEQRNKDTAENFSRMLADEKQSLGIIQFGAKHEPGLVKELQQRGVSVIVVTPREVGMRASQSADSSVK